MLVAVNRYSGANIGSVIYGAPRPALSCALRAPSCISTIPLPSRDPSPAMSATGSQWIIEQHHLAAEKQKLAVS
jgi:hypothetical protein